MKTEIGGLHRLGSPGPEEVRAVVGSIGWYGPEVEYSPNAITEAGLGPIEQLEIDEARLASVCRRYHVLELSVFGSFARGEAGASSDIDLLVSFESGAKVTLFTLVDLQSELANLLRRPVDLVPKDGLKPAIRSEVLADAQILYAA